MKLFKKIFIITQQIEKTLLYLCLTVSLAALALYLLDMNLNDTTLYFLLLVLRYSAFILCVCSLFKLIINIYHTVRRPSLLRVMKCLLYLFFIVYGAVIILLETFVSVVSGGNV